MQRGRLAITGISIVLGLGVLAGCGSSSKSSSDTTPTTKAGGGVTVPTDTAGTTVNITVSDKKGLDGPMTMVVKPATAKAGDVTFVVKNTGTIEHEVVVLEPGTPFDKIPITTFDGEPNRVDEATAVGETDPAPKAGETSTFTVKNMKAGAYALVCNLAKHYGLGMRAPFTVS